METAVEQILVEITKDRQSGATSLARRGLDALEALVPSLPGEPGLAADLVHSLAARLDGLRPSMGAVGVQAVLAVVRARGLVTGGMAWGPALGEAIRLERESLGRANEIIAQNALAELGTGGELITCSWSVTALTSLVKLRPGLVRVGEGHPLRDGARAAQWLAARGVAVELVPDAALPVFVERTRGVVVGADELLADGSLVNRAGTRALALAAHYHGLPVHVLCHRIKLTGAAEATIEEDPALVPDLPEGVGRRAPLFDLTPAGLVHRVITDTGCLSPEEAGEVGRGIAALRDDILSR